MIANNESPIGAGHKGNSPKSPAGPKRKREKAPTADIGFSGSTEGSPTLTIWQGLRGVCRALDEVQASIDTDTVDRLMELAAAARVLSELMEDRLVISPGGFGEIAPRI